MHSNLGAFDFKVVQKMLDRETVGTSPQTPHTWKGRPRRKPQLSIFKTPAYFSIYQLPKFFFHLFLCPFCLPSSTYSSTFWVSLHTHEVVYAKKTPIEMTSNFYTYQSEVSHLIFATPGPYSKPAINMVILRETSVMYMSQKYIY